MIKKGTDFYIIYSNKSRGLKKTALYLYIIIMIFVLCSCTRLDGHKKSPKLDEVKTIFGEYKQGG